MQSEPHAKGAKDAKAEADPDVLVREERHYSVNELRAAESKFLCVLCVLCVLGVRLSGFPLHGSGLKVLFLGAADVRRL